MIKMLVRQRCTDGFGAQHALAGLARQLRIERQRQPVHDHLLRWQPIKAGWRHRQPDADHLVGIAGRKGGDELCCRNGPSIGLRRIGVFSGTGLQPCGNVLEEAREGLAEQLVGGQRPHHANTGCIGKDDAAFKHHIERNRKALRRQRVGNFVWHPTLQLRHCPASPSAWTSADTGRENAGYRKSGAMLFMMRKSRARRKV